MEATIQSTLLRGGEFLVKISEARGVFIPEEITDEQKMMGSSVRDFQETHIWPNLRRIDKQEPGLTVSILDMAAELGLLGLSVPEQYGGMGIDTQTEAFITELLGSAGAIGVSLTAHTGIGTLPVLYFGTEAQKERYLPGLCSGEIKAAYCLTEPDAGTDNGNMKTKAVLSDDGSYYTITGQKMWITNAGFADLLTVFAKIEGTDTNRNFSAFLIDAHAEGVRLGAEEDKMGIKGSSTRQIFFEGVKIPAENLLGEKSKGTKIAFNVLNIGRYKLGLMVCGGAKMLSDLSVKYANERVQFDRSISSFGAIQHKLAEQVTRIFGLESANYRTANLLSESVEKLKAGGRTELQAKLKAAEEYAIECSILKVYGSETLDYVVDEAVQIYGGMGFSEETIVASAYRDSRINRIFEGTNEINRLLIIDMLVKRAMKGTYGDLFGYIQQIMKELMSIPDFGDLDEDDIFAQEKRSLAQAKKLVWLLAGAGMQKLGEKLKDEQEVIMNVSDIIIELFVCESALLRTEKLIGTRGQAACERYVDMTRILFSDGMERIAASAKHATCALAEGDELRMILMGIKRFTKYPPYNTVNARRRLAQQLIDLNGYWFFLRNSDVQ
jgi:alkylation response protein AidB-like acyl-CoA dehydrogenase